jgi:Fe(3+) dicitrate transport protein
MNKTRRCLIALVLGALMTTSALAQAPEDDDFEIDLFAEPEPEPEPARELAGEREPAEEGEAEPGPEPAAREPAEERRDVDEVPPIVVAYKPKDIFQTGGSAQILDDEEMQRFEYDDAHDVLIKVPGVYVRSEDGFGLRPNVGIRGTNSERSRGVTLMEDGVLFGPAPYSAPAAYYFPLMTRMVGVEVFKGPAAILYGPQTVGGSVNLLTRPVPEGSEGQIDVAYGSFQTRKAHLHYGASNDRVGFVFEGIDLASSGFQNTDFRENDDTGFHRSEFMLKGLVQSDVTKRIFHRASLKLGYSRERSNQTYLGLAEADLRADPRRRYVAAELDQMNAQRFGTQLDYLLGVGSEVEIRATAYRHDTFRVWDRLDRFGGRSFSDVLAAPDSPINQGYMGVLRGERDSTIGGIGRSPETLFMASNDRRFVSQGIQVGASFERRKEKLAHRLDVGTRLHYDRVERDHTATGYLMQNQTMVWDGITPEQTADNHASSLALAAFTTYAIEYKGLRVSPGVRFEWIETAFDDRMMESPERTTGTSLVALPGLGLSYAIIDEVAVFAGVHRGFSPVAPGQGDAVDPEFSVVYEAGVRFRDDARGAEAELAAFVNDYSNMLLTCAASTGCADVDVGVSRQFNAGSAFVAGLEARYAQAFRFGKLALPVSGVYTFMQTKLVDFAGGPIGDPGFQGARDGDRLPYVPMHQARIELGATYEDVALHLAGSYFGAMRETVGRGDEGLFTDDFFRLDAVVEWAFMPRGRVYARGMNLTNAQPLASRRPYGPRTIQPLTIMAGLKFDL